MKQQPQASSVPEKAEQNKTYRQYHIMSKGYS